MGRHPLVKEAAAVLASTLLSEAGMPPAVAGLEEFFDHAAPAQAAGFRAEQRIGAHVQRQFVVTVPAAASTLRHRGLVLRVFDRAITVIVLDSTTYERERKRMLFTRWSVP